MLNDTQLVGCRRFSLSYTASPSPKAPFVARRKHAARLRRRRARVAKPLSSSPECSKSPRGHHCLIRGFAASRAALCAMATPSASSPSSPNTVPSSDFGEEEERRSAAFKEAYWLAIATDDNGQRASLDRLGQRPDASHVSARLSDRAPSFG